MTATSFWIHVGVSAVASVALVFKVMRRDPTRDAIYRRGEIFIGGGALVTSLGALLAPDDNWAAVAAFFGTVMLIAGVVMISRSETRERAARLADLEVGSATRLSRTER